MFFVLLVCTLTIHASSHDTLNIELTPGAQSYIFSDIPQLMSDHLDEGTIQHAIRSFLEHHIKPAHTNFTQTLNAFRQEFQEILTIAPAKTWCHNADNAIEHVSKFFPADNPNITGHQTLLVMCLIAEALLTNPTSIFPILSEHAPSKTSLLAYLTILHPHLDADLKAAHTFALVSPSILYTESPILCPFFALAGELLGTHIISFPSKLKLLPKLQALQSTGCYFIFHNNVQTIIKKTADNASFNTIGPHLTQNLRKAILFDIVSHWKHSGAQRVLFYALRSLTYDTTLDLSTTDKMHDSIFTLRGCINPVIKHTYLSFTQNPDDFTKHMSQETSTSLRQQIASTLLKDIQLKLCNSVALWHWELHNATPFPASAHEQISLFKQLLMLYTQEALSHIPKLQKATTTLFEETLIIPAQPKPVSFLFGPDPKNSWHYSCKQSETTTYIFLSLVQKGKLTSHTRSNQFLFLEKLLEIWHIVNPTFPSISFASYSEVGFAQSFFSPRLVHILLS